MKSAPVTYSPGLKLTTPPPAFAHASTAFCIAFVEFVCPSPAAPYAFASQTFFSVGFRRAPTVFTHAGRPASALFAGLCAYTSAVKHKRNAKAAALARHLFDINPPVEC